MNRPTMILVLTAVLLYSSSVSRGETPSSRPVKIKIGVDTTRLTGPLKADGTVDYVAALNRKYGKGVTPENNAAVAIVEALGPEFINKKARATALKAMGVRLPAKPRYFKWDRKFTVELHEALDGSWQAGRYAHLATEVARNRHALDRLVGASRRSRYFIPLIPGRDDDFLFDSALRGLGSQIKAARALLVRANLARRDGRLEAAWPDILAVHRLGCLVGQGMTLVDGLIGLAYVRLAYRTITGFATTGGLSSGQARKILKDLRGLGDVPCMAAAQSGLERYSTLELYAGISRDPSRAKVFTKYAAAYQAIDGQTDEQTARLAEVMSSPRWRAKFDWNELLRLINRDYDRQVKAMKLPGHRARSAAYERLKKDLAAKQRAASRVVGGLDAAWIWYGSGQGMEQGGLRSQLVADRAHALRDLTIVSVALAAYRAENDAYPKRLDSLAPRYLKTVPKDFLSERPLVYKPGGKGYLLYSVGSNMKDDGGKHTYAENGPDDIVVQCPPPPRKDE